MALLKKLLNKKEEVTTVDFSIYSPLIGNVVSLSDVNDPVFAQEMMGKGIAVFPTVGQVFAPCDGELISVFRTLHALTIKADNGAEIIIHIGLETVALDGQHFESHVQDGHRIKKGDLLLTFDLEQIKKAGYDLVTPVIVTNPTLFQRVEETKKDVVNSGDLLMELKN